MLLHIKRCRVPVLAAAIVLGWATSAAACRSTAHDFVGLARSRAAMKTPAELAALSPKLQHIACDTLTFYKYVHMRHGRIATMQNYNPDYLSPTQNTEVTHAIHMLLQRELFGSH